MKRAIFFLFVLMTMFFGTESCRMRDVKGTPYRIHNHPTNTRRHFGAKKRFWQRREIWGRRHYGPRPYGHRGRYRY